MAACRDLCENFNFFSSATPGFPVNVTLSIVREQGSSGDVQIHFQTRPALYQPPSNQATEGQDYTPRDGSILMANGATVALVTVTILPVRKKKTIASVKTFLKIKVDFQECVTT